MTIRAPLFTRIERARRVDGSFDPGQDSSVLNTLKGQDRFFGVAGQPVANLDWQIPRGPRAAIQLRHWDINLLQSTLAPVVVAPFFGSVFPNPRGAYGSIALRTWENSSFRLLGQDVFFSGPGVGPDYDWPNPQRRSFSPPWSSQDLLTSTLGSAPVVTPFTQDEWQNPSGKAYPTALRGWADPLKINLLGQDEFFGGPGGGGNTVDFGNPIIPRQTSLLRGWSQNLLETTLFSVPPAPFAQDEWPLPRGAAFSHILRTWTEPLKQQLLGKDQFFGIAGQPPANLDWPVPKAARAAIQLRQWDINLLQTTLAPAAPAPFAGSAFPNPRGAIAAVSLRTWVVPTQQHLIGADQFFYGARGPVYDYPNPRGAPYPSSLRTFSGTLGSMHYTVTVCESSQTVTVYGPMSTTVNG